MQEISRRKFVHMLAGLAGWVALPTLPAWRPRTKTAVLQDDYIAGFQYYAGESLLSQLAPGVRLELRCEPGNPYDKHAVAVLTAAGAKLGYLPRHTNRQASRLLKQGIRVHAHIIKRNSEAPAWRMVRIRLEIVVSA